MEKCLVYLRPPETLVKLSTLLYGMQAKHIAFRVINQGDKTVFPDGGLLPFNTSSKVFDPTRLNGAISATEINQSAVAPGREALHFD